MVKLQCLVAGLNANFEISASSNVKNDFDIYIMIMYMYRYYEQHPNNNHVI